MNGSTFTGSYAVFGATGNLGRPIATRLHELGADVHAIARLSKPPEDLVPRKNFHYHSLDVAATHLLDKDISLDGFVFCIGHCPPQGFEAEISHSLSELPLENLMRDLLNHVTHLVRVYKNLLSLGRLKTGAQIVIIGSAITRLTEETCPPWLHAWHYIAANAAKEKIVQGMRHDPKAKELGLRIHYLAFGAVDTLFHEGCEHKPQKMLAVSEVVEEVIDALHSETPIHKEIVA